MSYEQKLKLKEIQQKFVLAKRYLKEAQTALGAGSIRLATDGAYNAAEIIMKIAILLKDDNIPKRHGSIAQKFSLLFVKTGILDAKIGSLVKDAFKFRNKARYDENAKITSKHATHNIKLAEKLIKFLENQLKKEPEQTGFALLELLVGLLVGAVLIAGYLVYQNSSGVTTPKLSPTPTPTEVSETTPTSAPETPAQISPATVSSKGKIAFVQDGDIWLINPDGSGEEKLVSMTANNLIYPFGKQLMWSNNGRKLFFVAKPLDRDSTVLTSYTFNLPRELWEIPFEILPEQKGLQLEDAELDYQIHYHIEEEKVTVENEILNRFGQTRITLFSEYHGAFDKLRFTYPEAGHEGIGSAQIIVNLNGKVKEIKKIPGENMPVYALIVPDGRTIQAGSKKDLVMVDNNKIQTVLSNLPISSFDISSDGKKIAYTVKEKLFILSLETQESTAIYTDPSFGPGSIIWSPDGITLAAKVGKKARDGTYSSSYQFLSSKGILQHTDMLNKYVENNDRVYAIKEFSFSPDGSMGVGEIITYGSDSNQLWLFDFEKGQVFLLTENAGYPAWQPQ